MRFRCIMFDNLCWLFLVINEVDVMGVRKLRVVVEMIFLLYVLGF